MSGQEREAPRIIVDEDWKSQVQAEMEALRNQESGSTTGPSTDAPSPADAGSKREPASAAGGAGPGSSAQTAADAEPPRRAFALPPASFSVLVSSLAAQAVAVLEPPAGSGETEQASPELARHFIDTLAMLETKTQGNLTADEQLLLSNVLHELRMLFVTVKSRSG